MMHSIFTVYDEKAQAHLPPFFMFNSELAIRAFTDCISSTEHKFHHHPSDYTLFIHGSWDDASAAFTIQMAPKTLGNGVEFIQIPRNEQIPDAKTISDATPVRLNTAGGDT